HADYTYFAKYGIRDHRGGGRSSGRETAARVAAGAVAKTLLATSGVRVMACTRSVGRIYAEKFDWDAVEKNPVRTADPDKAGAMAEAIDNARMSLDSIGGTVECHIKNVPAGWGEPVFDKLDAELAHAMLSLGAVKGIEFGDGFAAAELLGSENNDSPTPDGWADNHSGGVLGGMSNGAEIIFRIAVKPTPSIAQTQKTVDKNGNAVECCIHGRHDPCLCPRMVPVVEAMAAIVLADMMLRNRSSRI
ncbi:MAG: chorismate synthase, partial [Lentisphaeria bacterium]|nr:chorismate synthase [Lentisphaeria bacterium]